MLDVVAPLVSWKADELRTRRLHLIDRYEDAFRSTSRRRKPMRAIVAEVAEKYGVALGDVISNRRDHAIAIVRQEAMFRCRFETSNSLAAIGRVFDRDHSTVSHGIRAHKQRMAEGKL